MDKQHLTKEEQIALDMLNSGKEYSVSTFIDEESILAGYGNLNIDFEYPLPHYKILEIFGASTWEGHWTTKGFHQYKVTNLETGEASLTPYFTTEDFDEHVKLNGEKFKWEKIIK